MMIKIEEDFDRATEAERINLCDKRFTFLKSEILEKVLL